MTRRPAAPGAPPAPEALDAADVTGASASSGVDGSSGADGADGAGEARPRRRAVWIVLAALTAFVLVVPTCLQLFGQAIKRSESSSRTFRQPIDEVRLDVGDASVALGPGRAGEATVHQRLSWALSKPTVDVGVVGRSLVVEFSCDGRSELFASEECGADLDLRVPPGVRVWATSGSGEVQVRGLTGELDLRAGSGDVRLAHVSGRLSVRVGSGQVKGTGITSPKVSGRVRSGELDLAFAEPPRSVGVEAGSGSLRLGLPRGSSYRVLGWTGAGSSHMNKALVDDQASSVLSLRSGSGSTWVDYADAG